MSSMDFKRKCLAEFLGSFFLVIVAVSPTILSYNILKSSVPLAVFIDGVAVGFVLFALIEALGPISGCHINPAVTVAMLLSREIGAREATFYIASQFVGGFLGIIASHLMFIHEIPVIITLSDIARPAGCYFAEFMGTFLLVLTIFCCIKGKSKLTGLAVGLLVGGFLITTSSTMFANPQVTFARIFTYSIAGIRPIDALIFIVMEFLGGAFGGAIANYLTKPLSTLGEWKARME
ncbi:MAG: MIP/aquaporin family protein [Candidatus Nezhaarchaeales archaeon]